MHNMKNTFFYLLALVLLGFTACQDDEAITPSTEPNQEDVADFVKMQQHLNEIFMTLGTTAATAGTQSSAASCNPACPAQDKPTSGFCTQNFAADWFRWNFAACNLDNGTNAGMGTDCNGIFVDGEVCLRSFAPGNGFINESQPPNTSGGGCIRQDVRWSMNGSLRVGNCEIEFVGGNPEVYFYNISGSTNNPYTLNFFPAGLSYFKLTGYDDMGNVVNRWNFYPPTSSNPDNCANSTFAFLSFDILVNNGAGASTTLDYSSFIQNSQISLLFEQGTGGNGAAGDLWTVFRRNASDVQEANPLFYFQKVVTQSGSTIISSNPLLFTPGTCPFPKSGKINLIDPANSNVIDRVVDFGTGACDNVVTVTEVSSGSSYTLTID